MTRVRTIRCLRACLMVLFVVAQVAGVVPLICDHTLNVYEAAPIAAHGHPAAKPTVANPMLTTITACSVCTISAAPSIRWPDIFRMLSTPLRLTLQARAYSRMS